MRKLQHFKKSLRQNSTDAEMRLWKYLKNRQFFGLKFRRQIQIGNYIVDFICFENNVIIELDGGQHAEQILYDNQRTAFLETQGFKVMRFWNNELLTNTHDILEHIARNLRIL